MHLEGPIVEFVKIILNLVQPNRGKHEIWPLKQGVGENPVINTMAFTIQINAARTTFCRLLLGHFYPYHLQRLCNPYLLTISLFVPFCYWLLQQCGSDSNFVFVMNVFTLKFSRQRRKLHNVYFLEARIGRTSSKSQVGLQKSLRSIYLQSFSSGNSVSTKILNFFLVPWIL